MGRNFFFGFIHLKIIKMKSIKVISILTVLLALISCNKDEVGDISGVQSEYGEVGSYIKWKAGQLGVSDYSMTVTKLDNGVSTFTCSATTTNNKYAEYVKQFPVDAFPGTMTITGNTINAKLNVKITSNGVQAIFNDGGKITLVDYNAKVGDKYKATVDGFALVNEVIEKSTTDDYFWGGMYIKVVTVKSNSLVPGVSYIIHRYNHKFGLVGLEIHFEDGSIKYAGAECRTN